MTYEDFKDTIKEQIKDYLPADYSDADVTITSVLKNNATRLDGLSIRTPKSNICPNIYLNQFFTDYENGRNIEDILSDIARIRQMHDGPANLDVSAITDFDRVRDRIAAKLINTEQNKEYLADKPHRDIADLSAVYYINLGTDTCGSMTTVITNALLSQYGVTVDELHEIAVQNMGSKARFCSMFEVLSELMSGSLPQDELCQADNMMYVLTNDTKLNGAAMLLCPVTMDKVAKQVGTSYYIVPSSIHETLIVPFNDALDAEQLKQMVHEVNSTQVAPDEILSDSVYIYDYDIHRIVAAA
ncbi:MAG: hypothetical protein IJ526_08280 [Lachnospiraceae bacterium]|nr:hypothetical protein [Lachnospiraceae bacterium]